MKEKYLHLIWRLKRLPFHTLCLNDGRSFRVIDPGVYNEFGSGPDFIHAKILIDNILWVGNVEIHLRSSDWYRHGHHFDGAYSNVVLHVVLKDDQPVELNGTKIPTLEIGQKIDHDHYRKFLGLNDVHRLIPCDPQLSNVERVYIRQTIDRSVVSRLERKNRDLLKLFEIDQKEQIIYYLLSRSFGSKYNVQSFEELATRLPYSAIKRLSRNSKVNLIQQVSGTLDTNSIESCLDNLSFHLEEMPSLQSMSYRSWTRGGIRPGSKPLIRVTQFAEIVSRLDLSYLSSLRDTQLMFECILEYIYEYNREQNNVQLKISKAMIDQILINCFVPYSFFLSKSADDCSSSEYFAELLLQLPPEKNSKIDFWKKRGIVPENAWDTQGLLELYNESCMKKKMLNLRHWNVDIIEMKFIQKIIFFFEMRSFGVCKWWARTGNSS
jgi:hypothetical protein